MNSENNGNKNLVLLGIGALFITIITTCLSLLFYRASGDIYLDRSRPGYLPDEEEVDEDRNVDTSYTLSESGELTAEELTEYLKGLKLLEDRLKALSEPYSPNPLSDESLGIPHTKTNSKK